MFDAHNHFTNENSILCSSELLPQNISFPINYELIRTSEIGLDKRLINKISIEEQLTVFKKLLEYAKKQDIPVTLHCVHATELMIKVLTEVQPKTNTVIWHGFNGSIETARILKKLGILISIGPTYNKNIKELYLLDNCLLESDYEGTSAEEHKQIIEKMYNIVSEYTGLKEQVIEEKCISAAKAFENRINFR